MTNLICAPCIADLLELNGYAVTQATNGSDALAQLKLGLPPPSLILLDLAMPVLDGRGFHAPGAQPFMAGAGADRTDGRGGSAAARRAPWRY